MSTSRRLTVVRASVVFGCALVASLLGGCATEAEPSSDDAEEQAGAFSAIPSTPSEYPSDSDWALAMITRACGVSRASLGNAKGSISRAEGGVVYRASVDAHLVASAWARSTFIGAEKRCLTR